MTRSEALNVAVEALEYALENDADYLSDDTIAQWQDALRVLNQPETEETP